MYIRYILILYIGYLLQLANYDCAERSDRVAIKSSLLAAVKLEISMNTEKLILS